MLYLRDVAHDTGPQRVVMAVSKPFLSSVGIIHWYSVAFSEFIQYHAQKLSLSTLFVWWFYNDVVHRGSGTVT